MSAWSLSAVAFMCLDCLMLVNIDDKGFYGVCFGSVSLRECWLIIYTFASYIMFDDDCLLLFDMLKRFL